MYVYKESNVKKKDGIIVPDLVTKKLYVLRPATSEGGTGPETVNTKKSKKKSGEEVLYDPIKNYLYKKFSQFGKCEFEITSREIIEKVKKWLDDTTLHFIRVEKKLPDITGRFKPDRSKKLPYGFYKGLVITEVKNNAPTVTDIFQTKLYAEVFNAPFAYLISSKAMKEETARFLSKRSSVLYYGGTRKVYIGKFDIVKEIDETAWYPENPFPNIRAPWHVKNTS